MTLPPLPLPAHTFYPKRGKYQTFSADQMRAYGEACAAAERERFQTATALCDEHQPNGGARGHCVICSGLALSAALSKISYLCGEPNDMEVGPYDLHCDEDAVVVQVERLIATIGANLHCPCCGETIDCSDDCTFAVDCPADADNLSVLRDAVRAERRAKREQE